MLIEVVGLKTGGSVATIKDDENFPLSLGAIRKVANDYIRRDVVRRIGSYEIRHATSEVMVFVGFGAGPFGHNLVNNGIDSDIVHESVSFYCEKLRDILREVRLPVVYEERYSPHRLCEYRNDELVVEKLTDWVFDTITRKAAIPLMHGDMVRVIEGKGEYLDGGTSVASADRIIPKVAIDLKKRFANDFNVKRIVAATDIDGLYTKDPKSHKDAILIKTIKSDDGLEKFDLERRGIDVTGRMIGKVKNYQLAAKEGIEGLIVNGLEKGRIRDALLGNEVKGTLILP